MTRKSIIEREKHKYKIFSKSTNERFFLKKELKKEPNFDKKILISCALQKFNRNCSATRLSNRCFHTGRKRSVFSFFNLSKSSIRLFISSGVAPYITKSSF